MLLNNATSAIPDDGTGSTSALLLSDFWGGTVDLVPYPTFTYTCRNRRCTFNASGSFDDNGIASYRWDFGDGTVVTGKKKSRVGHRFPTDANTFTVNLSLTDTGDQTSSTGQVVRF